MASKAYNFFSQARTYQYCEAVAGYDRTLLNSYVGTYGNGNGQYYQPFGSCKLTTGNYLICDTSNNRIQEVTSAGVYVGKYGTAGAGDTNLSGPRAVARDSANNSFTADYGNNRIKKHNSAYAYVAQLAVATSGFYCVDVDTATDIVYAVGVGAAGKTLRRITNDLATVTHIVTGGNLTQAYGVHVKGDYVYVADYSGQKLLRYNKADLTGETLWTPTGSASPYSLGCGSFGSSWIDDDGFFYTTNYGSAICTKFTGWAGTVLNQFGSAPKGDNTTQPLPAINNTARIGNFQDSGMIVAIPCSGVTTNNAGFSIIDMRNPKYIDMADYTQALNGGFALTSVVKVILNADLQGGSATIQASTDSGATWTTITNGDLSTVSVAMATAQKIRFRITLIPNPMNMLDCRLYGVYMTYTDTEAYKEDMLPAINAFVLGGVM